MDIVNGIWPVQLFWGAVQNYTPNSTIIEVQNPCKKLLECLSNQGTEMKSSYLSDQSPLSNASQTQNLQKRSSESFED